MRRRKREKAARGGASVKNKGDGGLRSSRAETRQEE